MEDFSKAFHYHLQWKSQFKNFIDGNGDFDIAEISPDGCSFGKWLCSDAVKKYASPLEVQELVSLHDDLHDTAQRVYDLKILGQDNAAQQALGKIDKYSMQLSSLLTTLKLITTE